ncbi:MAG: DNA primase [Bacteroidales bacterium]|nr:DNA primase [Bacteroidales bacterium]MBO5847675.1 DNA primase [Bacteroidales bacterium]MBO5854636.1 DNA primase [Bacteroidales bacterium]
MIPQDTIMSILDSVRIEEVVGDFVSLKKRGANLIGVCPFHKEKTPSFIVSPAKGIFKCFGCGKAGDSVRFIMEHEHYSYPEALRFLAQKYGIIIEEKERTPEELMAQNERERMFNVNTFAQQYFSEVMKKQEEGIAVGMSYFRERGFRDAIIDKFQLGYCLNQRDTFIQHAIKNGYSKELLLKIGLASGNEERLYDKYQGRVIFPIHNLTGKVVGFGARILSGDKTKAKYLNSPESEIYNKSQTLYGIFFAKNEISRLDNCILVEGYADVLSMHQAGIENTVASSGTSLTTEQIRLISRYTKNVTILYDGDSAGIHAALRGTDMILEEGMNVRIVVLPPDEDPDSFVQHNPIEVVRDYISNNAKDFISFKTQLLLKDAHNDPIKRAEVLKDIVGSIAVIPDAIYRATYIKECSRLMEMPEQSLMNELNKILRAKAKKTGLEPQQDFGVEDVKVEQQLQNPNVVDSAPVGFYQEQELVKLLLMYGDREIDIDGVDENNNPTIYKISVASFIIDDLKNDDLLFKDEIHQIIFNVYDRALDEGQLPKEQYFISNENPRIVELAANLLSSRYKLDNWGKHDIKVKTEEDVLSKMVITTLLRYKDMVIDDKRNEITKQLMETENVDDQMILLHKKKKLDDIRIRINKELGIVVAK